MGDNDNISNDDAYDDTLNGDKIEIKMPHSDTEEKIDESLFESKVEDMLKDPSRIYNGRSNKLIFRSEDTDLKLFHKLYNVTTPIIAFTLNSEENFEFIYLDKGSIKSVYDDFGTIILTDVTDDDIHLQLYVDIIFPRAIESGEDYLVEHIIDKCIIHYNNNHDKPFVPKILSIITTSFSKLHIAYPNYAKKFISTLTIYNKNDEHELVTSSSDEHLHSYPKLIKEFPFLCRPYIFTIVIYLIAFIVNGEGYTDPLIVAALLIFYVLLASIKGLMVHLLRKIDIFNIFNIPSKRCKNRRLSVKLFIPFSKLASYRKEYNLLKELWKPDLNEFVKNHYDSIYSERQSHELYSDWNGEALINSKWERFGRFYYHCIWHIFNVFLIFSLSMIYQSYPKNLAISIINIILGFFLLLFEVRKIFFDPVKYLSVGSSYLSKYN